MVDPNNPLSVQIIIRKPGAVSSAAVAATNRLPFADNVDVGHSCFVLGCVFISVSSIASACIYRCNPMRLCVPTGLRKLDCCVPRTVKIILSVRTDLWMGLHSLEENPGVSLGISVVVSIPHFLEF